MPPESFASADPVQRRLRRLNRSEQREEAVAFLREFARETGQSKSEELARRRCALSALRKTGHYDHTAEELAFGARLAWRNHARCIGRIWWKSLEVRDCRAAYDPAEVAGHVFGHMRDAFSNGQIRSTISIFPPARAGVTPTTIESPQIIQYAGYLGSDGAILGDPQNVELTRTAIALGWEPPAERGRWDVLPVLVRGGDGHRHLFQLPPDLIHQVEIRHPDFPALADLGIKWYAVPCVSNMVLTIGGIEYPCAPFNGHYMATEIASRNLADHKRYNMLAEVAQAIGFSTSRNTDPLWRDRALTELNHAVSESFRKASIDIVDHHSASAQFMEFVKLEQREGRQVSAEWSWIVPPQASAACPVFHLPMKNLNAVPNFFLSRAIDGNALEVDRSAERRGKWLGRYDRLKRRWRNWRRQRDNLWFN